MERGKRAWTRSGRASVVRSQSAGSRPRSASRKQPPTTYAAWPPCQRVASRSATGVGTSGLGPPLGASAGPGPRSVAKEKVRAPALVAVVAQIRCEDGVHVTARLHGSVRQPELRLVEQIAALAVVARLAGGDQVVPRVGPASMPRHDVVQGEVVGLPAAVLAGVRVTVEDLPARQLDAGPRPAGLVLKADHGRRAVVDPRRPDHLVVVREHLCSLAEHQPEGAWQIAHVERFIVLVQDQDDALHARIL